jgi:hypothetical protein
MIRNLTIVAVASFVLAIGCFTGAFALGGPQLLRHGWNFPADWNITVGDDHDNVHVGHRYIDRHERRHHHPRHRLERRDALQIDAPAEVIFTQAAAGAGGSVRITGPKALVDRVTLENGRLGLRDGAGDVTVHVRRDSDQLSIEIVAPGVRSFTVNGSGDLHLKGYDQPTWPWRSTAAAMSTPRARPRRSICGSRARARRTCAASTPATPRSPWPAAARPAWPRTAPPRSTWPAAATST